MSARAVYGKQGSLGKREAIPAFLRYAHEPARRRTTSGVSAAVFGLSAARDLGIGQLPRRMAPYLDTVYAMTYPSLFGTGELGLADPSMSPGATVSRALRKFELALRGQDTLLVPWVQDFSFSVPYGIDEVRAQIDAARLSGAKGFMLWNAEGLYTDGALAPALARHGARRSRTPAVERLYVTHAIVETIVAVRPELDPARERCDSRPRTAAAAPPRLRIAPRSRRPCVELIASVSGRDCADAQAAIWLPRGRVFQ